MVTLLLDSAQLEVVLSPIERALSFHKGSVRIDRSRIVRVQLTDDAWTWLRGVPSPGTQLPGVLAMGTWKSAGGSDFVVLRRRVPAVVIDVDAGDEDAAEYQRVILSTRNGIQLAQALRLETDDEATDVANIVTGAVPTAPTAARPRRPRAPRIVPAT